MSRRIGLLLSAVVLLVAASGSPALAQDPVVPGDICYAIVHGSSSSTFIVYMTFPPEWENNLVHIESDGPSGSQWGESTIDLYGSSVTSLALYSYGTHTITYATITIAGVEFPIDMFGLGDGGTYVVDDSEPECDPSDMALVAPTTTTVATTTTTEQTTTTIQETTTTTLQQTTSTSAHTSTTTPVAAPSSEGESTGFPWPVSLIGFGLLFILGGVFLARREDEDPCEPLRIAWQADEDRWKRARDTLAEFEADLEERRQKVNQLEARLAVMEVAARSSTTLDGQTRHTLDGGPVRPEELAEATAQIGQSLESARSTETAAEQTVKEWIERVAEQRAKADASKAAYEECIGSSVPGVSDGGGTSGGDTSGGETGGSGVDVETGGTVVDGGSSVATPPDEPPEEEEKECEEPHEETRPGGAAEEDTFVVDFSVIIEVEEGTERKVQEAEDMAFGLNDVGNILDAAGNLLTGTGALKSVVSGLGAMSAGKYVMGTKGLAGGAAGGAMFADVVPSVPTNPAEAMVEFLEQTAKLGGLVAEKAGEWLTMNQLYSARVTYFQQTITATPFEKWVCEDDKMVCKSKFWEYTVGPLSRRAGPKSRTFRLESDIARTQWNRELRTLAGRAQKEIERSVQKRVQFDQDHHPSACES